MEAGFTIAEVAEHTGLTAHTLRYYERAGLLSPPSRGTNGHRRYSELDLGMLRILTRLRATGMSIAEMRRYAQLCRSGPATFEARRVLLEEHRQQVLDRIAGLRADLESIETKIKLYAEGDSRDLPVRRERARP
ncbi:MerR family transcriptional regulator [Dactylosporangium sp. CA-233914]|uniref:MerR family transcriptional regulator n=1 Tax=Dactylosporangium sp. CA-233914 TaxID=3239934 RepID=UPI003D926AB4